MSVKDVQLTRYTIREIGKITHDTNRFVIDIPRSGSFEFLPGDHIRIYPDENNPLEFRSYTITSTPDDSGFFELIIKRYPESLVSAYMHSQNPGDKILISGPHAGGHFSEGMAKKIGFVAGGTGITPMISIIRTIIRRDIGISMFVLFANKTIDDIILREEFDQYAAEKSNFDIYYVLSHPPADWPMGSGRINAQLMSEKLPEPSSDTIVFVCGPPLMQLDMRKRLIEIGHEKNKIIFP